jgi:DNA-binding transcriptional ArsR family regulator
MTVKRTEGNISQGLVKALAHPLRHRLLAVLNNKVASPSQLADELGEPLGNVSYHVRILADLGCIELVGTTPRRGALEHHYRATVRPFFNDDEWRQVPLSVRQSITGESLEFIFREAIGAAAGGDFDSRDSRHLSRTPLVLDEEGWDQVTKLLADTLDRVIEIQTEAAARMAGADEEGLSSRLVILHYPFVSEGEETGAAGAEGSRRKRAKATG